MPIKVSCKNCGETFQVKEEMGGRKVRCKVCSIPVRVPDEAPESKEDELPLSPKEKKKLQGSKRKGRKSGGGIDPSVLVKVGVAVAVLAVIGGAIFVISSKNEANRQMTETNKEIDQRNQANAAADAAMTGMHTATTPMPGMMPMPGMSPIPGATPMPGMHGATPAAGHVASTPMPMPMPTLTPIPGGAPGVVPVGSPATPPM